MKREKNPYSSALQLYRKGKHIYIIVFDPNYKNELVLRLRKSIFDPSVRFGDALLKAWECVEQQHNLEKKADRNMVLIPIYPHCVIKQTSVDFVNEHLQNSLQHLHLSTWTKCEYPKACEVIRCMIKTDILAELLYYIEFLAKHTKQKNIDFDKSFSDLLKSDNFIPELTAKFPNENKTVMIHLYEAWKNTRDIRRDPEIAQVYFKMLLQKLKTTAVAPQSEGFVNVLFGVEDKYILNNKDQPVFSTKFSGSLVDEYTVFEGTKFICAMLDQEWHYLGHIYCWVDDKELKMFGIRKSVWARTTGVTRLATDFFTGLVQLAKKWNFDVIHITKPPIGYMLTILNKFNFTQTAPRYDFRGAVDNVRMKLLAIPDLHKLNVYDLGCAQKLQQEQKKTKRRIEWEQKAEPKKQRTRAL